MRAHMFAPYAGIIQAGSTGLQRYSCTLSLLPQAPVLINFSQSSSILYQQPTYGQQGFDFFPFTAYINL